MYTPKIGSETEKRMKWDLVSLFSNVPGVKVREGAEGLDVGEERSREAKIAFEEVPSTEAMGIVIVNGSSLCRSV